MAQRPYELFNRELSWLAFNARVLEEAEDPSNPLLERLRFLTIFHTNLDEFFMIRVSGLQQQVDAGTDILSADGLTPRAQLDAIHKAVAPLKARVHRCLTEDILPALRKHGVTLCHYGELTPDERARMDKYFHDNVYPVLTPLAVDPTHPFPLISNLSVNLGVMVHAPTGESRFARIKVPAMLPRLLSVGLERTIPVPARLLPLEELVAANLSTLFPGMELGTSWVFRVTRDADFEIGEDEADDLLAQMERSIQQRRFGSVSRLEVQRGTPPEIVAILAEGLEVSQQDVYEADTPLALPTFGARLVGLDLPALRWPAFVGGRNEVLQDGIFETLRRRDVLLHHPFDAFAPVVEMIREAAHDPAVLAIKQTLYRTSGDSPIIQALVDAAMNGKQVAVVVELKARFDEANNIEWARRLERAGVHVVYGMTGLKVHCKLLMIVRDEDGTLRRYAHIGTGNYNHVTSRIYTDLGLLTSDPEITADVADVFNRLTGFALPPSYRRLLVAPRHMSRPFIELIRREAAHAAQGRPARIIFKCNGVTEPRVIRELYAASQAGVRVDLLVRGICCLVPGVPGLSETIEVRSVVGRFLEHSRVYWFENGGEPEVLIGSADLMDRNLHRRMEVLVPVRDPELASRVRHDLLTNYLRDNRRTRQLQSDGTYIRLHGEPPFDVHRHYAQRGRG
jgi:polyphosphate kinase